MDFSVISFIFSIMHVVLFEWEVTIEYVLPMIIEVESRLDEIIDGKC